VCIDTEKTLDRLCRVHSSYTKDTKSAKVKENLD